MPDPHVTPETRATTAGLLGSPVKIGERVIVVWCCVSEYGLGSREECSWCFGAC